MVMHYYCKSCALLNPSQSYCQLNKRQVIPDKDYCSSHSNSLFYCEICNAPILNPILDITNGEDYHILCSSCANQRSSCSFCAKNIDCAFENDPSPTPKVIVKTMQQGNSYIQTQVMNPDRVRETCEKKCFCFDAKNGCLRQNNWCDKQQFTWKVAHHA